MASGHSNDKPMDDLKVSHEVDQTADFQSPTLGPSGDGKYSDKELAGTVSFSTLSFSDVETKSLNDSPPPKRQPSISGQATSAHYTPGREIARGGMGAVLEANDELLGRTVAMKVIREGVGDADKLRKRFIREASVLAKLEHPNIVPIHELGRDRQGQLFYTMKKVEGRTLQAIIDSIRHGNPETIAEFSLDRLLLIFRKICDAMAFAHTKGIIHRDLKPENVMIGAFGEALVMDWGLAKAIHDKLQTKAESASLANLSDSPNFNAVMPVAKATPTAKLDDLSDSGNLTMDGSVLGSPRYMAPEQAMGRIDELDERSDIFSLGGILYCILTLRPPIEGGTLVEILENVRSGVVKPPTQFSVKRQANSSKAVNATQTDAATDGVASLPHCPKQIVPAALSAVCMKAMSLDPAARYQAVTELSKEIESYQAGFATSAENASFLN
jgi:serine/threonine protein kinase